MWLVGVGGIYGCGLQVVGVASECGCKVVYLMISSYIFIPTPLASALFCSSIPTFCSFFMFSFLSSSSCIFHLALYHS